MLCFYDTETSGLPNKRQPPTHESQPHLVQIGLILTEYDGTERARVALIVKPDRPIPVEASNVHGITTDIAEAAGVPLRVAVSVFTNLCRRSTHAIAHNEEFDRLIMDAACHRAGAPPEIFAATVPVCTMKTASPIVNLPPTEKMVKAGFTKNKPPNLTEALKFFTGRDLVGAHDALVDVDACREIYFELVKRGALPEPGSNDFLRQRIATMPVRPVEQQMA